MIVLITGTAYNTSTVAQRKYALVKQMRKALWKPYRDHVATGALSVEHCALYCRMISFTDGGLCQMFMYESGSKECHVGNRNATSPVDTTILGEHDVYFDTSALLLKEKIPN